jgi:Protein of unknown function (DUF3141)
MQRIPGFSDVFDYAVDAAQRSVLFWDTLRERGNEYRRHNAAGNPPLLKSGYELLLDGRTLEPPCNDALLGSVAKFRRVRNVEMRSQRPARDGRGNCRNSSSARKHQTESSSDHGTIFKRAARTATLAMYAA